MQRISVIGTAGSGKSTLAHALSARLHIPYIELDALHWLPNWKERDVEQFRAMVRERVAADAWVVDGNYRDKVQDIVWARADTIVWLDLSREDVMRQVITRTLRRWWHQEVLWSGNRETLATSIFSRDSIVRWAWTTHAPARAKYTQILANVPQKVIRLHSRREVDAWLNSLPTPPAPH